MDMDGVMYLRITGDILVVGGESGDGAVPWTIEAPLEMESEIRDAFFETPAGVMRVDADENICAVAAANSFSLYGLLVLWRSFISCQ